MFHRIDDTIIRKYVLFIRKKSKEMATNIYDDKWIGIDEAADYIGVNKDTVHNRIKKETDIPVHRVRKLRKFKRSELDLWIKSGKSAMELEKYSNVTECIRFILWVRRIILRI